MIGQLLLPLRLKNYKIGTFDQLVKVIKQQKTASLMAVNCSKKVKLKNSIEFCLNFS
jgi:hypothetical protein